MPEDSKPGVTPTATPTPTPTDEVLLEVPPVEKTEKTGKRTPEEIEAENERLKTELSRTNKESAGRRKKLEEYEKAEQAKKDAELSEKDKADKARAAAEKERDDALKALHHERLDGAIEREAAAMGFEYPEDVARLIDRDILEVTDGKVKGLKKALSDLAEAKPKLLKEDRRTTEGDKKKAAASTAPPRREMNNSSGPPEPETDAEAQRSALLGTGRYQGF